MSRKPIKGVEEYLKTVWAIKPPSHAVMKLYRGQSEAKPLLPRLFRSANEASRVKAVEQILLKNFKNDSPFLLPSKPGNDWDWLSLGQHFKLPTRLLDWSANPLTALFFAVECAKPESPTVYIYHCKKSQIVSAEDRQKSRYAAAILPLQKAIQAFQVLRTQGRDGTDIGPGLGAFYIWLGEAEAGERHLQGALENYRKASAEMKSPAGRLVPDDTLCQLATSYVKAGDVLTKMRSLQEASASYEKALDIITPLISPERQDVPALYPAADAYAGLGDVAAARARIASDAREQAQLGSDARTWYEKSLSTWQNIPNPSGIGLAGFKARAPHEIARRLAECKSAPQ